MESEEIKTTRKICGPLAADNEVDDRHEGSSGGAPLQSTGICSRSAHRSSQSVGPSVDSAKSSHSALPQMHSTLSNCTEDSLRLGPPLLDPACNFPTKSGMSTLSANQRPSEMRNEITNWTPHLTDSQLKLNDSLEAWRLATKQGSLQ